MAFDEPPLLFRWSLGAWVRLAVLIAGACMMGWLAFDKTSGFVQGVVVVCLLVLVALIGTFMRAIIAFPQPLRLTSEGIEAPWVGLPTCAWSDIATWWVEADYAHPFTRRVLCLRLKDPARLPRPTLSSRIGLRLTRRFFHRADVVLHAEALTPRFEDLLGYAKRALEARGLAALREG